MLDEGLAKDAPERGSCAAGARSCAAEIVLSMKAMPPSTRPCPGMRRPRPGSLGRGAAARAAHRSPREPRSCEEEGAPVRDDEVLRLRGLVHELTARCERQSEELDAFRGCAGPATSATSTQVQTEELRVSGDSSSRADEDSSEAEQRLQLDVLHREVGDKGRELRKAQDTVGLLRRELQQQRQVSEQYQAQMDMLEEQLRALRSAESRGKNSLQPSAALGTRTPRSCPGTPRPSSARAARAWQEDDDKGGLCNSSAAAAEAAAGGSLRSKGGGAQHAPCKALAPELPSMMRRKILCNQGSDEDSDDNDDEEEED
ncbi:unnamed protein product [Polarella glacialis]|uniref:Uncharacterized protein n=1 Tax=Polarella glacialis TaxID=89957 RepID=A0A813JYD5_POLGL|nr:unnamed protein product [Polarella glacialis]CAE8685824.1 unnamed protein product [Polarella glacialis]